MNELLQNAIHISLRINKEKFGLHKEEQGWFIVNRKSQYLFGDIWSSVNRSHFSGPVKAYEVLIQIVPIEYSSEGM